MLTIECIDIQASIDEYVLEKGYRLNMIAPADSPSVAVLERDGESVQLVKTGKATPKASEPGRDGIIVASQTAAMWVIGRAGMQYRNLVPGNLHGKLNASHIMLVDGGEVADYAHYHKIAFQMIFCRRGRIKVVYEDQGPPFWLETGDCVLQPPEIRHRVLESTAGAEVVELGSPAYHETWVDHEMELPTDDIDTERAFAGQTFVRHIAADATWTAHETGIEASVTPIAEATGGLADVRVTRAVSDAASQHIGGSDPVVFLFVLRGSAGLKAADGGTYALEAGDSCLVPKLTGGELIYSSGTEMLEVRLAI